MTVFRIAFTVFMLLLPLALTLLYRPRPESDRTLVRRRRRHLLIATALALALYGALLWAGSAGRLGFWAELPRYMTWSESLDEIAWVLFFPLWFPFGMRLVMALRPEAASPYAEGSTRRTASLSPRSAAGTIPLTWWLAAWGIWAAAAAAVIVQGVAGAATRSAWTLAAVFLVGGAFPLLLGALVLPLVRREPEPLDPAGSEELRRAYDRLRRVRTRGLFLLMAAMSLLFSSLAVALFYLPEPGIALGVTGGVGGSLLGVTGAVFGTRMSHRRMEIRRLLDRLSGPPAS